MAKKNSTKTATKEALQASEPRVQTFSQWGGMYIKESPYGWTTDYEFERHGHVQNQTDLKPNFLMIQDNVISTSTKSLETRNETQLVSTAPYDDVNNTIVQRQFTGVTCLAGNYLYAAFDDGSIRRFNLDDAPHMEVNVPTLTKWIKLDIIDADAAPDTTPVFNWTSINYFQGQLVCFNKQADGIGEIYSGAEADPFQVNTISSTRLIPDPREESQKPIIIDVNTTVDDIQNAYNPNKLYIRQSSQLILYQNKALKTSEGRAVHIGDSSNPARYDWEIWNGNEWIEVDIWEDMMSEGYEIFYDKTTDPNNPKVYKAVWNDFSPDSPDDEEFPLLEDYVLIEMSSNEYTLVDLPHRVQIAYTYSNKFGQTLDSLWTTVYSNLNPLVWNSDTGGAEISQIVPGSQDLDYSITGVDIYYVKDDSLDMNFLGHIEKDSDPSASINTLMPGSTWKYIWYGAYADISEWTNVSLTVPTENTTKGVNAAYMNVHDGRCYFFGGSQEYRLYIGGRVGHELCVAAGIGGAYVDIEPGSGMVINNTHKFKTYNGANIVTIMCGHPNTHQVRRFNLIQTNITLTNELSAAGFTTEEVSNVVGCLSHHGSGVWAQGLFTLSRYGLALTTQQMENSNNLRAQLVSDAIQPIFTESLASALHNTQMIFVDDIVYFALSRGPQYLNCGLIGQTYNSNIQYYTRDEYEPLGKMSDQDHSILETTILRYEAQYLSERSEPGAYRIHAAGEPPAIIDNIIFDEETLDTAIQRIRYKPFPTVPYDFRGWARSLDTRSVGSYVRQNHYFWAPISISVTFQHHQNTPNDTPQEESFTVKGWKKIQFLNNLHVQDNWEITDELSIQMLSNIAYKYLSNWLNDPADWMVPNSLHAYGSWGTAELQDEAVNNALFTVAAAPNLYYAVSSNNYISAQNTTLDNDREYYNKPWERRAQFMQQQPPSEQSYYRNIYHYYLHESILDDIIFAYDVNSQAWYTFTYQPNLISATIEEFGPDTPQDTTVDPENSPVYSTAIKSLINFDSQYSPEGIGIVTTDCIEMIPTAGIVDNVPTYSENGEIEVPNFVAHIETGELSTSSPPQQFHTLSQLEFRFDYFFGDIDIDIEGVDYYGRTFHIHKDVTYDEIQQDLAVYVRVDYIVNTYNIKIKGRAHFRLTHVMAKVYPESRKINLVYGFDDSSLYKKRHGGTQFTHHYIKDYNNLRRALEP